MRVIVFEDNLVQQLHPVSLGRPAYAITCGSYRLIDWLTLLEVPVHAIVRPHIREIQRIDYPDLDAETDAAEPYLLVNARLVPSLGCFNELSALLKEIRIRGGVSS